MVLTFEELEKWLEEQTNKPDQIHDLGSDVENIETISNTVKALAEFAKSLVVENKFEKDDSNRYILRPANFVAFSIHYKKGNHVRMYLSRPINKYSSFNDLPLSESGRYVECIINQPSQLLSASKYIYAAHQIYKKMA